MKYYQMGNPPKSHKPFLDYLKQKSVLQKVDKVDECDLIITFSPDVSQVQTDFKQALEKLKNVSGIQQSFQEYHFHVFLYIQYCIMQCP